MELIQIDALAVLNRHAPGAITEIHTFGICILISLISLVLASINFIPFVRDTRHCVLIIISCYRFYGAWRTFILFYFN